uniref:Uncharacterized protein n=1 Tax=Fagus sylvatica TaxID=28930 RepID=A0A2N9GL81_FAGSY
MGHGFCVIHVGLVFVQDHGGLGFVEQEPRGHGFGGVWPWVVPWVVEWWLYAFGRDMVVGFVEIKNGGLGFVEQEPRGSRVWRGLMVCAVGGDMVAVCLWPVCSFVHSIFVCGCVFLKEPS